MEPATKYDSRVMDTAHVAHVAHVAYSLSDLLEIKKKFELRQCVTQIVPLKKDPSRYILIVRKGLDKVFIERNFTTEDFVWNYEALYKSLNYESSVIPNDITNNILGYFNSNQNTFIKCSIGQYYDVLNRVRPDHLLQKLSSNPRIMFSGICGKSTYISFGPGQEIMLDNGDLFIIN
jgi:hypothetical protein